MLLSNLAFLSSFSHQRMGGGEVVCVCLPMKCYLVTNVNERLIT